MNIRKLTDTLIDILQDIRTEVFPQITDHGDQYKVFTMNEIPFNLLFKEDGLDIISKDESDTIFLGFDVFSKTQIHAITDALFTDARMSVDDCERLASITKIFNGFD